MAQATFKYGEYRTEDYTPGSAVNAGDIILDGDYPAVAHRDIAANEFDSLAIRGGVYALLKDGTSGPVFEVGDDIDWDDSANLAVAAGSGQHFGRCVKAAGASDAEVWVEHNPSGLSDGT